jgi:hypothetical protein
LGPPVKSSANNAFRLRLPQPVRREDNYMILGDINVDDDLGIPERNIRPEDEEEEPEGYKHFCDHFRINPGTRCTECNKCDLYLAEDEEAVARRAGEQAEREWRMRQGMLAARGLEDTASPDTTSVDAGVSQGILPGIPRPWDWDLKLNGKPWRHRWRYWLEDVWREGRWKWEVQAAVDWVVERAIVVEV